MRVPSYDDLTPSIPDVEPGDLLAVEQLLPGSGPIARGGRDAPIGHPSRLFACLYAPRMPDVAVAIAKDFSPRYQRYGTDSVVLDVSGLGRLLGEPPVIGAELARAVSVMAGPRINDDPRPNDAPRTPNHRPRTTVHEPRTTDHPPRTTDDGRRTRDHGIRVAVAPTQIAALLLARTGAAPVVNTTEVSKALAAVPIDALRHLMAIRLRVAAPTRQADRPNDRTPGAVWPSPEACERAFDTLARWGLRTLGEFAALPAADLSARMGQAGVRLQELARGIDPQPLVPEPDAPRFVERMELEWPIEGLEPLSFVLARLLDPLTAALERADRAAAVLRLELRLTDRTTHQRVLQLSAALRDARVFRTLLVLDLESHPPAAAIDVVTIEIDPAPARVLQYSLLEPATASVETLATLTARLGALVGASRCGSPRLVDSHRPDAFEMRPFVPGDRGVARDRPGQEAPGGPALCLRRFRPAVTIRVALEHGRPVDVAIDRRGMPGGRIEQSAGPWRTSGAWWRAPDAAWNHDEWDVTFGDGTSARVSRDRTTGRWFMEAIVD